MLFGHNISFCTHVVYCIVYKKTVYKKYDDITQYITRASNVEDLLGLGRTTPGTSNQPIRDYHRKVEPLH